MSRRAILSKTSLIVALTLGAGTIVFDSSQARAQESRNEPDPRALLGSWRVDLRPTPDAEPYYQEFVVRSVEDGALSGTFYGTEVKEGRVNADWGRVHFAFVTKDASGSYNTSGVLVDGRLQGRTHALGRSFLSVWTAEQEGMEAGIAAAKINPGAPPETSQFAFLLGGHQCSGQQMRPDGTYVASGEAAWNGRLILDGWAIEDEWIAPQPDGTTFRGINIRSFNPKAGKWDNRWLPTGSLEWKYFEAEQVGETMVMIGGAGEDGRGAFVDRNVFSETGAQGFKWRKDRSWDGGETWIEGIAKIDCSSVGSTN